MDDCESSPCQNNGICIDAVAGFRCNCSNTGYTGILCQDNENECKKRPNICLNNGICYDTYGSFICECPPDFVGFNCEQLIDTCVAKDCPKDTICVSGQCCEPDLSGKNCKSYTSDDCNCLNGGVCNGNSTVCICSEGYEGTLCENDIDECFQKPNVCVHGICVNQPGTFKCYCEPGKLA